MTQVTAEVRWCPSEPADGGRHVWVVGLSGQHSHVQQQGGSPDLWSACLGPERLTGPAHWRCAPVQFCSLVVSRCVCVCVGGVRMVIVWG